MKTEIAKQIQKQYYNKNRKNIGVKNDNPRQSNDLIQIVIFGLIER